MKQYLFMLETNQIVAIERCQDAHEARAKAWSLVERFGCDVYYFIEFGKAAHDPLKSLRPAPQPPAALECPQCQSDDISENPSAEWMRCNTCAYEGPRREFGYTDAPQPPAAGQGGG